MTCGQVCVYPYCHKIVSSDSSWHGPRVTMTGFHISDRSSPGKHFVEAFLSGLEETLVLQTQTLQQVDQTAIIRRIFIRCRGGSRHTDVSRDLTLLKSYRLRWECFVVLDKSYYRETLAGCAPPLSKSASCLRSARAVCWSYWNRSTCTSSPAIKQGSLCDGSESNILPAVWSFCACV